MNDISNNRIKTLMPVWERFLGATILFDNPGNNYEERVEPKISVIKCRSNSTEILLYRKLYDVFKELLPSLKNNHLLCPLPLNSYHVTLADLANQGNVADFNPSSEKAFQKLFSNLPNSLTELWNFSGINTASVLKPPHLKVKFKFKELKNWKSFALVAGLDPADAESAHALAQLKEIRKKLNFVFQEKHGFSKDITEEYYPHISLGYFANPAFGELFEHLREQWNDEFLIKTLDENNHPFTIQFNQASFYGFTDMANFFRKS